MRLAHAPARTALVHDWLTGMRGGENVLAAMAAGVPEAPIYTLFHFAGRVDPEIEAHPIHTSFLQRAPGVRRHYRRYLPLFPAAIEGFDLPGYDLVLSSSHCVAKGIVPGPGALHVCYCHSPMRYAWDQEHRYFPRRDGIVARARSLALSRLRTWDVASAARVDLFLANSRFVATRIRRYYRREAEVLHPPVDTEFFTPGEGRGRTYCLAVGAAVPYKRLDLAIAACERAGCELRIVADGPDLPRLRRLAGPRTRVLGPVAREELRELYRGALCLVQPGVEDFGIASVEALACGTPVVALGAGGVLDVVEDGEHGSLFSPEGDVDALAAAVDKCRRMGFNHLNLRRRAEAFSAPRFLARLDATLADCRSGRFEGSTEGSPA